MFPGVDGDNLVLLVRYRRTETILSDLANVVFLIWIPASSFEHPAV